MLPLSESSSTSSAIAASPSTNESDAGVEASFGTDLHIEARLSYAIFI